MALAPRHARPPAVVAWDGPARALSRLRRAMRQRRLIFCLCLIYAADKGIALAGAIPGPWDRVESFAGAVLMLGACLASGARRTITWQRWRERGGAVIAGGTADGARIAVVEARLDGYDRAWAAICPPAPQGPPSLTLIRGGQDAG